MDRIEKYTKTPHSGFRMEPPPPTADDRIPRIASSELTTTIVMQKRKSDDNDRDTLKSKAVRIESSEGKIDRQNIPKQLHNKPACTSRDSYPPDNRIRRLPIISNPDAPYLDWIRQGIKTAEGRVYGTMLQNWNLQKGDRLVLANRRVGIVCEVVFLHTYRTFEAMLMTEGIRALLPQIERQVFRSEQDKLKAAVNVYERFPASHRVKEQGAVAIGLRYLNDL